MASPFDDPDGTFHVVVNDEGQHALWPSFVDVPAGWAITLADNTRAECLAYVSEHWTDMRPRSLVEAMRRDRGGDAA